MKEQEFIERNKESWRAFEESLKSNEKKPENFWRTFMKITGDLAYARTFYPNRSVRVYLNYLSQLVFNDLKKNRKRDGNAFAAFWLKTIPMALFNNRKAIYLSLCIFVFSFLAGYMSSVFHPEYIESILGSQYVAMTKENIAAGDPMAVYKQMAPFEMSFAITFNNIRVAFLTFITGLFASIGSVGILLYNGMMIAAFHKLLFDHGIVSEMLLTVYMHGAMEISAITIAGGAGLVLGKGLLFPGSYTRLQAFQKYSKEAIYIFISTLPLFFIAGMIEGFITRLTMLPDLVRLTFILSTLAIVVLYYFVFPVVLKRRQKFTDHMLVEEPLQTSDVQISFKGTKTMAEIIKMSFRVFRVKIGIIFKQALFLSLLATLAFTLIQFSQNNWNIESGNIALDIQNLLYYAGFDSIEDSPLFSANNVYFIIAGFTGLWLIASDRLTDAYHAKVSFHTGRKLIYYAGLLLTSILAAKVVLASSAFMSFILAFVVCLLLLVLVGIGRTDPGKVSIAKMVVNSLRHGIGGILVLIITGLVFGILLYYITQSAFVHMTIEILTWSVQMSPEWHYFVVSAVQWTITCMVFFSFLLFCKLFIELLFTHVYEIVTADSLYKELAIFASTRKSNGIRFEK